MTEHKKLTRRSLFAGVGLVAAAGVTAKLLKPATDAPAVAERENPARGGGYHLSEHVKKYYRTTTI